MLDYFHPVSNFPFLEKVVENVAVQQLLWAMDKVDYLTFSISIQTLAIG